MVQFTVIGPSIATQTNDMATVATNIADVNTVASNIGTASAEGNGCIVCALLRW